MRPQEIRACVVRIRQACRREPGRPQHDDGHESGNFKAVALLRLQPIRVTELAGWRCSGSCPSLGRTAIACQGSMTIPCTSTRWSSMTSLPKDHIYDKCTMLKCSVVRPKLKVLLTCSRSSTAGCRLSSRVTTKNKNESNGVKRGRTSDRVSSFSGLGLRRAVTSPRCLLALPVARHVAASFRNCSDDQRCITTSLMSRLAIYLCGWPHAGVEVFLVLVQVVRGSLRVRCQRCVFIPSTTESKSN
jgi:hypothetical protein